MKRFLIALALGSLAVFGSANAALLNFFSFGDGDIETSFVFSQAVPASSEVLLFQNPTISTGYNPEDLTIGLSVGASGFLAGNLIYSSASDAVDFFSFAAVPPGVTASGSLPNGVFALGLKVSGTPVSLETINFLSQGAYQFIFVDGTSVIVDDLIAVPIPAAALLFLSGIGGLLLVARRNNARNRKEHPAGELMPA